MDRMNADLVAYICVVSKEGEGWDYLALDEVEWKDESYGHQN